MLHVVNCDRLISLFATVSRRQFFTKLRESYTFGASTVPLINGTIGDLFGVAAERVPDQEFCIFSTEGVRKTYGQTFNECRKFANGLLQLGLRPGDRIGIWSPNNYEWILAQIGSAMAGLISVNINPAYQVPEVRYCLEKVGVRCLIAAQQFKAQNYYEMLFEICPELANAKPGKLKSRLLPMLEQIIQIGSPRNPGTLSIDDICTIGNTFEAMGNVEKVRLNPDSPVNIQFTSGTTGRPKGATLTHHQVVNNAYFVGRRMGAHEQKLRICCPVPLYHCFGCVVGSLVTIAHQATIVFTSPAFSATKALIAVESEKCNTIYGTPAMYIDMLNSSEFPKQKYDTLHTAIMTGSPCPTHLRQEVVEKFKLKDVLIIYGTTENSPATNMTKRSDPPTAKLTSVGQPLDHVEVKIADRDGCPVQIGTTGEIWTRGYMIMHGYWHDVDKTREVVGDDRWYRSGDLGTMDGQGYVSIVGRIKDMIIRGGENVYPTEIENFLMTHLKVADAQVIGVPDERLGEELCAWIRPHPKQRLTAEDVRQFCKGKIAHFKIPKYILIKNESEFPVTVTGKIQKYRMREISKHELGLEHVHPQFVTS